MTNTDDAKFGIILKNGETTKKNSFSFDCNVETMEMLEEKSIEVGDEKVDSVGFV